jgi:dihydrofolate reductase
MTINKAWHRAHPMPARATRAQRLAWHEAHAKACGCRPIPAGLQRQLGAAAPARRRLRYGVAISLDGFIAGTKGEFDWIVMDPAIDFGAMYREFDTAVMGRKTHEVMKAMGGGHGALPGIDDTVVFSRTLRPATYPRVRITREDPRRVVQELKARPGKDIWLYGGGRLFRYLLDAGLVDTVEVAVIPVILGAGIPLLQPGDKTKLVLADFKRLPKTGIVCLSYSIPGGVGPAPRIRFIRRRAGAAKKAVKKR